MKAAMKTIENFISFEPPCFYMAKDSELVKEVEKFLKKNEIRNYRIAYDRGIDHGEHPHFEVELNSSGTLERLSKKLNISLKNDCYSYKTILGIEGADYDLDIYKRMKIPVPGKK